MSYKENEIKTGQLQYQVAEFTKQLPHYKIYADALKRILEKACKGSFPDAYIQARPKSVTSFAEKCVRKRDKYPDAVNQLTDLCGGRVIVQTLEQVKAVRQFIEANFKIHEADEKGLSLGDDKFGYRDMHYIVQLIPEKAGMLGFQQDEIQAIGDKRAEIQVRTWVQHAWADTLHDRIYKTKLKYPAEFKRTGSLLAAIMEEGDRDFNRLAGDIDGMLANFNAYAPTEEVDRELGIQNLILSSAEESKKPGIALKIGRLVAARGEYARVVDVLSVYAATPSPLGCAIRLELGYALCRLHRATPRSDAYRQGQDYLRKVVEHCREQSLETVPDLRRRMSTLARALARLAWSYEAVEEDANLARACYREALELEPSNPYYLADVIGHESNWLRRKDFIGAMTAGVRTAIGTCGEHIRNGTEMPYAAFTAGRLHLLLDEVDEALGSYARGIQHVLACTACVPPDIFAAEERWLVLVTNPDPLSGGYRWAMDLLHLAGRLQASEAEPSCETGKIKMPILIVAGGATSLQPGQEDTLRPMLVEAFTGFAGTVFSGGTRVGVPGCVGEAAETVAPCGKRPFTLIGYIPRVRPGDAPEDARYDRCVECGEQGFSAEQILRNWTDILAAGVRPEDVRLLGFGGGSLCAVEYRIALGFGACVGLVAGSGGTADAMLKDDLWAGSPNLLSLPSDRATVRAFAHPPHARAGFDTATLEKMAEAVHEEYVRNSQGRLPDNMKPWQNLKPTFKIANLEQAKYSVQILESCGFDVRPATKPEKPVIFASFTEAEIERMAEMEHGRWNVERLRNGWRHADIKDEANRLHNCLVPWSDEKALTAEIKNYDRAAVHKFPEILAEAGLEVHRRES